MKTTTTPAWITLAERVYQALLVLYPPGYRGTYGPLMVQLFRDVSRDRYRRSGVPGVVLWWCRALLDLGLTVIEQRRKVKLTMSKTPFAQLTGILLIVGGACIGIAAFSQLQPDDHYTYYGVYQALVLLIAPGFLLIGLGCAGIGLRYEQALGTSGQWAFYLGGFGAVVMSAALVATFLNDALWNVVLAGVLLHIAALTVFGLWHVLKPMLPIFRALPLQIALGMLFLMLIPHWGFAQNSRNAVSFLIVLGVGLAWLAIGLTVRRQQRAAIPVTA